MPDQKKCKIWSTPTKTWENKSDGYVVNSPRAGGKYYFSDSVNANLERLDETVKVSLTNWLVEQRLLGISIPEIYTHTLKVIEETRAKAVMERADDLLLFLSKNSTRIDAYLKFDPKSQLVNELLAWTSSTETREIQYLCEFCANNNWLEFRRKPANAVGSFDQGIRLLPGGYEKLDELRGRNLESKQAFVAMWFDDSIADLYECAIAPAIRDAGYVPLRIDKKDHNNKIDDEIVAEIRRSRFVIADFTHGDAGMRGGVYYEAGFAHGMDIPVIFTCRDDVIGQIHFDTRQYNHIVWNADKFDNFRKALTDRISATIGDARNILSKA